MPVYPFLQVDAFTTQPLGGNPCAVLLDTEDLSAEQMLAVAREMNLSETAFVRASSRADFGVRYFTPAEEIPLAGHPTIATVQALIDSGRLAVHEGLQSISLELQVGPIPIEIEVREGTIRRITMTQKQPQFLRIYTPAEVMPAFGLSNEDVLAGFPIQTVSTGTPQLMVPVRNLETLRKIQVDVTAYLRLRQQGDFFSPHLFCLGGITPQGSTFARHFGAPPDTPEDPFTGSATGGMAAYLWRYGLLDKNHFIAEQGHWMGRPGQAEVTVTGDPEAIERVQVGGTAVTILRGEFYI